MSAEDQIVSINISQQTQAVPQASFSVPAVMGPSNRFAAVTPTGTTVSGSKNVTSLSSLAGVSPGCSISGTGIPVGTYVQSVSGSGLVLSQNATASGSVTLTITDAIRAYTGLAGMTTDGFQTSDPEYIRASEFLGQNLTPAIFYVGRYSASVDASDTITVNTGTNSHVYSFTLNGVVITFTAVDTSTTDIAAGLAAALNTAAIGFTAVASVAIVTITSNVPGVPAVYTAVDSLLTHAVVTANHSITTDIAQAQVQSDAWYGLCICSTTDGDITQVAAFIEGLKKIFLGVSNDVGIPTSSGTDLASTLKGLGYKRTGLMFSIAAIAQGIEAGWLGGQLPALPGSNNWAFKTIAGASPDTLTASQQAFCIGVPTAGTIGKNVNIYQTVGGVNITQMGTMAGGQFIDITVGLDWLESTLQTNLFAALVDAAKIPYTDKGTGVLLQAVKSAIDQGVLNGLIDGNSPITISAPPVLSVSPNNRALRIAPPISFSCRLQGAFNAVTVNGTVTV